MNLKKQFNQLTPGRKKTVIWCLAGIVILALTFTGYNSRSGKTETKATRQAVREIQLEADMIEKTMLKEQRQELNELKKTVQNLETGLQKLDEHASREQLPEIPNADQVAKPAEIAPPAIEQNPEGQWPTPPNQVGTPLSPPKEKKMIGEISVLSNQTANEVETEQKKKARTVYLPPSFMEAKLLTGFDAATSGQGKNNPEPLLLRIQTPAVLPNDIKTNLAGCFVMAEAVGRLDKERADVRLVSLSCLSNEGKAIIDTPIKGFVTDTDSKVGLSGRVVSKMGAATARTIVAGFFGGMGDMLKATATTQSVSPLGTTTTVDSSQIAKYGVGGGLSEGARSLHDFYLSLARQATPVIEVGAAKEITVIVSEGKELEIKEYEPESL
jgi:conjugal transfer pilus assembly protein TraB